MYIVRKKRNVTPRSRTVGATVKRECGKLKISRKPLKMKYVLLKSKKMDHTLIYLKMMTKDLSEIIIFPSRFIDIVYKKNIKFRKKSKF